MMQQYTVLAMLLFSSLFSFSQNNEIESWQKRNAKVDFISEKRFNSLSSSEQEILKKQEYIIFKDEITVDDINKYASKKGISGIDKTHSSNEIKTNDDAIFIKEWIELNRDVKLITQSDFNNLTTDEQQFVLNHDKCLVLQSDKLTKEDILLFNNRSNKTK